MSEIDVVELAILRAGARPRGSVVIVGRWAATIAFLGVLAFGVVQTLQVLGLVSGLLSDGLIFGTSLAIAPPFLVAMLALHHLTEGERRFFSQGAVSFATLYAAFAMLIYVVQLASVIPAQIAGSAAPELVVTPHSLFWTVDALAYISMGIASLFAAFALPRRAENAWLFRACIAHAAVTPLIAIVYFYPAFSIPLLLLGTPWLVTALLLTFFLARSFRRPSF